MKYILFDLDSTLYYLDERNFLPVYFDAIGKKAVEIGYEYEVACHAMYDGSVNMSNSDGVKTNEQLFWEAFEKITGPLPKEDREKFDSYYDTDFDKLKTLSKQIPGVKEIIKSLKEKGYVLVVATNPVLPMVAQLTRMNWAGLDPKDFAFITSYESFHYSKPDPRFYLEAAKRLGAKPEDCLMVGNDVRGDILAAKEAGLKVFLITDYMSNHYKDDASQIPQGHFEDLVKYIESLK